MIEENLTEITKEERMRILRDVQGTKCFCRRRKSAGQAFCKRHHCALPQDMRMALISQRSGAGYEEAHKAAREYFEKGKE